MTEIIYTTRLWRAQNYAYTKGWARHPRGFKKPDGGVVQLCLKEDHLRGLPISAAHVLDDSLSTCAMTMIDAGRRGA